MESIKCHWCRQGVPETQGVILGKSKIKIYKHDNVVERPGNTMSTILLDVISESIQICDSSFCVDSLNHMYFRAVWGLSTDSFPAWKHRNCAIDFIRLWVLFMFLLIPYFRMLDDIGKTSSPFSRPCSTALRSPRLFLLSTDFLAQFWHDEMSCSHSTHTWLNVKHHPPMVDQISHVSHL